MKIQVLGSALAAAAASTGVEMRTSPFIQEAEAIGIIECSDDFVGTVKIQSSDDDSTYGTDVLTFVGNATTGHMAELSQVSLKRYMRANVTAYTAGTVNVKLMA